MYTVCLRETNNKLVVTSPGSAALIHAPSASQINGSVTRGDLALWLWFGYAPNRTAIYSNTNIVLANLLTTCTVFKLSCLMAFNAPGTDTLGCFFGWRLHTHKVKISVMSCNSKCI